MYTVYSLTTPDGRVYIGSTSMKVISRWNHGNGYRFCKELWEQIQLHGWENITKTIIAEGLSKSEADSLEKAEIEKHKSTDPALGYNREGGGMLKEKVVPDEVRQRMSEATSGPLNHNYGKHFSEEHKSKIAESNRGLKRSEETKRRVGEAKSIPVNQYDLSGVFIKTWKSAREAGKALGVYPSHISKACMKKQKTSGGYVWEYA